MKKILIATSLGFILLAMAFSTPNAPNVGAIGDVKYSVLPPDKFIEENGTGWVLMDDKIPLSGSILKQKHGVTELPDSRGLFIRSLNLSRTGDHSDPFKTESPNKEERKMGEYQEDAVQEHFHSQQKWTSRGDDFRVNNAYGVGTIPTGGVEGARKSNYETRPKNIALYTYVKINN